MCLNLTSARKLNIKMKRYFSVLAFLAPGLLSVGGLSEVKAVPAPSAVKASKARAFIMLRALTSSKPIGNGIEIHSESAVMQVTALRDDVLRVRVGPLGQLPEDASWAALPEARTAKVGVS